MWEWLSLWIVKKIRSPFSNLATKFTLVLGSTIVASPLVEHLIFNVILKHWLNIDLKIEVPDTEAYLFGSLLILASLIHNLLFIKLTSNYQIKIKETEGSVYKKLWIHLDTVIDDTARLTNLFCKVYDKSFDEFALKAEESVINYASFLRKNRPFFFSEELYEKCSEINNISYKVTQYYRACLKAQMYDEGILTSEKINDVSMESMLKNYNFYESQKLTMRIFSEATQQYDLVCSEIRKHINAI